jgi:hypothetical protein
MYVLHGKPLAVSMCVKLSMLTADAGRYAAADHDLQEWTEIAVVLQQHR